MTDKQLFFCKLHDLQYLDLSAWAFRLLIGDLIPVCIASSIATGRNL
jgi:hypothetical protein